MLLFVGIDISKSTFDVSVLDNGKFNHRKFDNTLKGFNAMLNWIKLGKRKAVFCMEATGVYGVALAKHLHKKRHRVVVVNPLKTHSFAKLHMTRNKTDKADSQLIAKYIKYLHDENLLEKAYYQPKSPHFERLQHLVTRLAQLEHVHTQEKNRLSVSQDKLAKRTIESMCRYIEKQQQTITLDIKRTVKADPDLSQHVRWLVSIPGIGDKTAWSILAYLGDVAFFSNAKQVASYAGLSPSLIDSGSSVKKTKLSKMGNPRLRKALYMPAMSAARFNPVLHEFYQRLLDNGKTKKAARCAVMRKLLVMGYGVIKSKQQFDPNYAK